MKEKPVPFSFRKKSNKTGMIYLVFSCNPSVTDINIYEATCSVIRLVVVFIEQHISKHN